MPQITASRMELQNLKNKLKTATRGHKLLKDKFDELIVKFTQIIRETVSLRKTIDEELAFALEDFLSTNIKCTPQEIEEALIMPTISYQIYAGTQNILGVIAPKMETRHTATTVSGPLHNTAKILGHNFESLIKLAEMEKTCEMLASEIEKCRRRANNLEYVFIPKTQEAIKSITLRLNENERQTIARLMQLKQK